MQNFLRRQRALQLSAFGIDPHELTGEDRVEYVRMNVLAAIDELMEMLHHVDGWKNWQTSREHAGEIKDLPGYIGEGVDVLHFLGNLLNVARVVDDSVLEHLFTQKQRENARRQLEGYDGIGHPQEIA